VFIVQESPFAPGDIIRFNDMTSGAKRRIFTGLKQGAGSYTADYNYYTDHNKDHLFVKILFPKAFALPAIVFHKNLLENHILVFVDGGNFINLRVISISALV